MCDPVSIGSAIVTAAGTAMQMQSQKKAQRNMQNAINANGETNDKLQRDSQAKTLDAATEFSRPNFDKTSADETAGAQKQFIDAQSQGVLPGEYYGESAGDNVKKFQEQKSQDASAYTQKLAAAQAKLSGFSGGMRKSSVKTGRAAEQIAMNNNFTAGNNAVLPLALEKAKQSGQNPLADLMVGLGSAGIQAGLSAPAATAGKGAFTTSLTTGANAKIPGVIYSLS